MVDELREIAETEAIEWMLMDSLYWEGFVEAAQALGVQAPTLSGFAMRQELNRQFGFRSSPVIVFAAGAFAVLHLEELVVLLGGKPPQFSFFKPGDTV